MDRMSEPQQISHEALLVRFVASVIAVLLAIAACASAQMSESKNPLKQKPSPAAISMAEYLERARAMNAAPSTPGSIWNDNGRLARMMTDIRAMRPHDLVAVVVSENLAASMDGTVKGSRASNASSQVSNLFGNLHAGNALQNLINQNSAAGLDAQGTSATNSSLSTIPGRTGD